MGIFHRIASTHRRGHAMPRCITRNAPVHQWKFFNLRAHLPSLFPLPSSLILLLFLAACAVPQPPTGGPTDSTPPLLVESVPLAEAVNVDTRTLTLTFNEYLDQASFARALSITPEPEGQVKISWRRRTATLTLPDALLPNTTYIVTLDNTLRDAHGVTLKQPITLAFATGPVINRGRLEGQVVHARDGSGAAGVDVYAYAAPSPPDSLPERPTYRTQTNESGLFSFAFLREQPYFVVALEDRNRNRLPDPGEALAAPPEATLLADTTASESAAPWILHLPDTTPPELQRLRSVSNRRLTLRFSEPVQLLQRAVDRWSLSDSASGTPVAIHSVYQPFDEPRDVVLLTDSLPAIPHRLLPTAVADSSGNRFPPDTLFFSPSLTADTLRTRFAGFWPDSSVSILTLPPPQAPAVRFTQPPPDGVLPSALAVRDTTSQPLALSTETRDGTTFRLLLSPPFSSAQIIDVAVDNAALGFADTVFVQRFQRLSDTALGAFSGVVQPADTATTPPPFLVQLFNGTRFITQAEVNPDGTFLFEDIATGTYRFRVFADQNGDGQWSAGTLTPYNPAEPILWAAAPTWRARWDTALADTLRLSIPPP